MARRMKLFISWSGPASQAIALTLSEEINTLMPWVDPWFSSRSILPGRWRRQLFDALHSTDYGIICLMPDNIVAPWIFFEMGIIVGRANSEQKIAPIAFGGLEVDTIGSPISDFQIFKKTKADFRKIIGDIYNASRRTSPKKSEVLNNFDSSWNRIRQKLTRVEAKFRKGDYDAVEESTPDDIENVSILDPISISILEYLLSQNYFKKSEQIARSVRRSHNLIAMKLRELHKLGYIKHTSWTTIRRVRRRRIRLNHSGYAIDHKGLKFLEKHGKV